MSDQTASNTAAANAAETLSSCELSSCDSLYTFVRGLDLSESFFQEVVKPLIAQYSSELVYSAALIGNGSEVIECDTAMSMDHDWGPRVLLFLKDSDLQIHKSSLSSYFSSHLPRTYKGFPTNFSNPDTIGVRLLEESEEGQPIHHNIRIFSIKDYLSEHLGVDTAQHDISSLPARVWLTIPEQKLLTLTMGRIFVNHEGNFRNI
jgi:hypothetical protein